MRIDFRLSATTIITHCFFLFFTHNAYSMDAPEYNAHKDDVAFVKYNEGISFGEKEFLAKRLPIVKATLEKTLQRSLQDHQIPNIAIIGSGGGYRAMLYLTAFLHRAEKIGLLDGTTYISALSGSTWALASWISSGMTLEEFKMYIQKCAEKPFHDLTEQEKTLIWEIIKIKKKYKQPCTLVDPYGDLLANRLLACLGDQKQTITLSAQTEIIKDGSYPYPIYVAIDGSEGLVSGQTCTEYTPHTIGERKTNLFIPTWAYGKTFEKGVSTNDAPEKPLGYHMGQWGSAFGASIDDAEEEIASTLHEVVNESNHEKHRRLINKLANHIKGKRFLPFYAKVSNPLYGMENIPKKISEKKHIKRVDAGLERNLPDWPVNGMCKERTPDILIFVDISAGEIGPQLKKTYDYAREHQLPFPTITEADFNSLNKKTCTIFEEKNTPTVIYMPRISDKNLWEKHKANPNFAHYNLSGFDLDHQTEHGFAQTIHFQYAPEHSTLLMNQAEFNLDVNTGKIIKTINRMIDRK